jgi:serine/threonine-protein kinase
MTSVGQTLGRYRLEEALGRGGSGTVFRARDLRLGTDVCVKVLHEGLAADAESLARFEREVLLARKVSHPGICQVFDVQEDGDTHFLVMEWVEGRPLSARLAESSMRVDEAVRIVRGICEAVAAAHAKGVVHRDLKPQNIMVLDDGTVKVLDFGIATTARMGRLTEPGAVMGTAAFLAPEALTGQSPTPAWDIWAIGVILYRCLAGRLPFRADNFEGLSIAIREQPHPPVREFAPKVPEGLEAITRRALQKQPTARFGRAEELDVALAPYTGLEVSGGRLLAPPPAQQQTEATQVVRTRTDPGLAAVPRSRSKTPLWFALGGAGAAAIAVLLWLIVRQPPTPAPPAPGVVVTAPTSPTTTPDPPPPPSPNPAPADDAGARVSMPAEPEPPEVWEGLVEEDAGDAPSEATDPTKPAEKPAVTAARLADRRAYRAAKKELDGAIASRGLRPGDDGALDKARAQMKRAARRGRYKEAADHAGQALSRTAAVSLDKAFILSKLSRFNKRYDLVEDEEKKRRLGQLAVEVNAAYKSGAYERANRLLNEGFQTAGRTR